MSDLSADTLSAIAALATVGATLIVALCSGVWGVKKWADERRKSREQEETIAFERLQQQRIEELHRREDKVADLVLALGEAKSPEAQLWSAAALALYPDQTLPLLTTALGHTGEETASVINLALASIGPPALPDIVRMNRVAQMIVAANAAIGLTYPESNPEPAVEESPAAAGEEREGRRDSLDEWEFTRLRGRRENLESADVVGASQLVSRSRSAIGYLILQCRAEQLCELDLENVDLRAMSFASARLDGVRFRKAFLEGAVFAHAKLSDSNFRGARLANTNFLRATARGGDFTGIRGPIRAIRFEAPNAIFQDAVLDKSILDGARFQGASFLRTSMKQAQMAGVDMTGATVRNAAWSHVAAAKSILKDCQFTHVRMEKAELHESNVADARFVAHCRLSGLRAERLHGLNVSFEDCDLGGAVLTKADLRGASFARCNLGGAQLNEARLEGCTFDTCKLHSVSFAASNLQGAHFIGVQGFDPARLDLTGATWNDARFDDESAPLGTMFAQ